jgi:methylenetetrahydrofolate reductase (NADPH)
MKIKDLLGGDKPVISFEFFPPKTPDGNAALLDTIASLKELRPSFVSMTYGAGGSTRQTTISLVEKIKDKFRIEAAAHLTCVGHTQAELAAILGELMIRGIENVIALRGDPPKGQTAFTPAPDGFRHAAELVRLIRRRFPFCIGVAGYPEKHVEARTMEEDLIHLQDKVGAGADFVITQLFFNNDHYFRFVAALRKRGIAAPIIPGIMPITDVDQIQRFSSMCGAQIPAPLLDKLNAVRTDKESVIQIGAEYAAVQCVDLLKRGAPGIHFYTLNKSRSALDIFRRLKSEGIV